MFRKNILIAECDDFSNDVIKILSEHANVHQKKTEEVSLIKDFRNYDVFWFRLGYKINEDILLDPERRVSIIVCPVTGLDHIDLKTCKTMGIKVISLKGETEFLKNIRATAELTIALMLSSLRHLFKAINSVKKTNWDRDRFRGSELNGNTVGIVGMGRLGNIVADILNGFGSKVIAFDIREFRINNFEKVNSLTELVEKSNIVTVHVDYNSDNYHMFNSNVFSHFKRGSIFINTSRGSLVDEHALLASLKEKRISVAAVDVVEDEYNFSESPLVKYAEKNDNLIITPHIGGSTYESFAKTEKYLAEKLINLMYSN